MREAHPFRRSHEAVGNGDGKNKDKKGYGGMNTTMGEHKNKIQVGPGRIPRSDVTRQFHVSLGHTQDEKRTKDKYDINHKPKVRPRRVKSLAGSKAPTTAWSFLYLVFGRQLTAEGLHALLQAHLDGAVTPDHLHLWPRISLCHLRHYSMHSCYSSKCFLVKGVNNTVQTPSDLRLIRQLRRLMLNSIQ